MTVTKVTDIVGTKGTWRVESDNGHLYYVQAIDLGDKKANLFCNCWASFNKLSTAVKGEGLPCKHCQAVYESLQ